ncbi:MAG TPA: GNAT family N-acetyltransferase [Chlamydiales bacterium]|nr:GNAT family N-acetyltransferase [Chlamydiales bacterium]
MSILSCTAKFFTPANVRSFLLRKRPDMKGLSSLFPRTFSSSSRGQIPKKNRNWAYFGAGILMGFCLQQVYASSKKTIEKEELPTALSLRTEQAPIKVGGFKIQVDYEMKDEDTAVISKGLAKFNTPFFGHIMTKSFAIYLRDENNQVVGGVTAWMRPGIRLLMIDTISLPEHLRRKGYGTQLLLAAENEGLKHGCTHSQLETLPFQAEGFYNKMGYFEVGRIEKFYGSHDAIYMRKYLIPYKK